MTDPVLVEMSERCRRLLRPRVLIAHTIFGEPFKELSVGRVFIHQEKELLRVDLFRLDYTYTIDTVYVERNGRHASSTWPTINDALLILRSYMILDDLASA